jgi:hypothetical protein
MLRHTLPDQVGSLLLALHQFGVCAQRQSVFPKFHQTFLINTNPVGERAELYLVNYSAFAQLVTAAIGEEGLLAMYSSSLAPHDQPTTHEPCHK